MQDDNLTPLFPEHLTQYPPRIRRPLRRMDPLPMSWEYEDSYMLRTPSPEVPTLVSPSPTTAEAPYEPPERYVVYDPAAEERVDGNTLVAQLLQRLIMSERNDEINRARHTQEESVGSRTEPARPRSEAGNGEVSEEPPQNERFVSYFTVPRDLNDQERESERGKPEESAKKKGLEGQRRQQGGWMVWRT